MTDLKERRVLVAGGTGDIGEAIARALFGRGAMVMVPARYADEADLP
jgi:NAD(P)-dependent dehydrogenase (short-subunit alcohol dehydrogenase family)